MSDPFGRFLTTSMLPKLALLWEQRRVLFFVATNNIDKADPAIRRSQRFDAAIFTAPPSFSAKKARLEALLGQEVPTDLNLERVTAALAGKMEAGPSGVFALLRWDQLAELAAIVRDKAAGNAPSTANMDDALKQMGEGLQKLEFAEDDKDPFDIWREYREYERRDFGRPVLGRLSIPSSIPSGWATREPAQATGTGLFVEIRGQVEAEIRHQPNGKWRLETNGWIADDDELLDFTPEDPPQGSPGVSTEAEASASPG